MMRFPSRAAREVHEWRTRRWPARLRRALRWVVLGVVGVALLGPASSADAHTHRHHAHAQRRAIRYSPISAAYTIAARYWGVQPCNGDITITAETPPKGMAVGEYMAAGMWASWDAGSQYENDETAPQPFWGCHIGINPAVWPTEYFEAFTAWPDFAVGVVHEFGHLLGHVHSIDPRDVMFGGQVSVKAALTGEYAPGWG